MIGLFVHHIGDTRKGFPGRDVVDRQGTTEVVKHTVAYLARIVIACLDTMAQLYPVCIQVKIVVRCVVDSLSLAIGKIATFVAELDAVAEFMGQTHHDFTAVRTYDRRALFSRSRGGFLADPSFVGVVAFLGTPFLGIEPWRKCVAALWASLGLAGLATNSRAMWLEIITALYTLLDYRLTWLGLASNAFIGTSARAITMFDLSTLKGLAANWAGWPSTSLTKSLSSCFNAKQVLANDTLLLCPFRRWFLPCHIGILP